jgi:hypothetical protein
MDNFDLKKFLKESKALENLNPTFKTLNENKSLRDKIKEMIVTELDGGENYELEDRKIKYGINPEIEPKEYSDTNYSEEEWVYEPEPYEDELEEAKKKKDKDVEDVEDVELTDTIENIPADETPAEETPAMGGGLEDVAANMEGTEGELMDSLMKAFKIAKGMGNEKLETQVGNTLKFFVSEYIGGGED